MTVVDQAENVGGVVSAARLRESFMHRRANAANEEQREALGDAIGTLEVRFPELEDLPAGGAERFARERGHGKGARSPSHEGRRRAGAGKRKPDAAPLEKAAGKAGTPSKPRKASPSPSRPSSATRRTSGGSRPSASPRVGRAWRETGIPGAGASTSSIVMSLLGGTVGLAAVYLILTSAERQGGAGEAIPTALKWVTGFLNRVIAPVDIFGRGLSPKQYARVISGPETKGDVVNRVLRQSGRFPGELGAGGRGATLSNPRAELMPRLHHKTTTRR